MQCFRVIPSRNSMTMNELVIVFADLVDRADVGVIQRRCRPRLAPEAF